MIHSRPGGIDLPHRTGLRAIIYLRSIEDHEHCQLYADARRHRVVGVVLDPTGQRYLEVVRACLAGQYDVILLRRLADLPPERLPRTEIADVPVETVDVRPRRRRPRPR